jgi:hypothetical protein
MQAGKMPNLLADVDISQDKFTECASTEFYKSLLGQLKEENMQSEMSYEDTYNLLQTIMHNMPIKNFEKGYTRSVTEKKFD